MARASLLVPLVFLLALPGFAADLPEAAVPERTARRLRVRPGDVLEVAADPAMRRAQRVRVAVVWNPAEHPADVARQELRLVLRLPFLEALTGRPDTVDRVVVRLRQGAQAQRVREDLEAWAVGFDAYTAEELAAHTSRAFVVVSRFHRAIALVTLLAGGIFLVAVPGLRTSEMRREIGALRLVGIGRGTIALAVVGIATGVALLGTLLGLGIGAVLVAAINAYYQPLFQTSLVFAVLEPRTVAAAAAFSVLLGIFSGVAVAARLLRQPPLEQVSR
ncbi:MAG: FtsX-like permease family protein [Armatimonadota bacterium]|nr:FtsX-like permease family protein [Armatimonadota bacterium]